MLAGWVPTASGLSRVGAVDTTVAGDGLRAVLDAAAASAWCTAARRSAVSADQSAGAGAITFDLSLLPRGAEDDLGELAEAGLGILAGALDTKDAKRMSAAASPAPKELAGSVIELWRRIGLPRARLAEQVVVTPACGLAGFSAAGARAVLASCRDAARILPELIEEGSP